MLLPPGLEELIPADHPSRVTGELIGEMDAGYIKLRNYFLGGTKIEAERKAKTGTGHVQTKRIHRASH